MLGNPKSLSIIYYCLSRTGPKEEEDMTSPHTTLSSLQGVLGLRGARERRLYNDLGGFLLRPPPPHSAMLPVVELQFLHLLQTLQRLALWKVASGQRTQPREVPLSRFPCGPRAKAHTHLQFGRCKPHLHHRHHCWPLLPLHQHIACRACQDQAHSVIGSGQSAA